MYLLIVGSIASARLPQLGDVAEILTLELPWKSLVQDKNQKHPSSLVVGLRPITKEEGF
jgi:hypothetical protein